MDFSNLHVLYKRSLIKNLPYRKTSLHGKFFKANCQFAFMTLDIALVFYQLEKVKCLCFWHVHSLLWVLVFIGIQ